MLKKVAELASVLVGLLENLDAGRGEEEEGSVSGLAAPKPRTVSIVGQCGTHTPLLAYQLSTQFKYYLTPIKPEMSRISRNRLQKYLTYLFSPSLTFNIP